MRNRLSIIAKWLGRLTALLLLLFWGAFFVEHLSEWFLRGDGQYPPPSVWLSQVFHITMLVGLGLMLRWDRPGSVVALVGTAGFFACIWDVDVLPIVSINLVPVLLFAVSRWLHR